MITREQVADLQPGDVVEVTWASDFGTDVSVTLRGPLQENASKRLAVGNYFIRTADGAPLGGPDVALTVVSRAPRPLYVNHPRTEPVPGDVVRQEDGPLAHTWHYLGDDDVRRAKWWRFDDTRIPFDDGARLRLLVDGETGQAVPS